MLNIRYTKVFITDISILENSKSIFVTKDGYLPNFWVGFGFLQKSDKRSGLIGGLRIFCGFRIFGLWIADSRNTFKGVRSKKVSVQKNNIELFWIYVLNSK